MKKPAKLFGGFIFYSYLCIGNKNNLKQTTIMELIKFSNILRTIVLVACVMSMIIAHGSNDDFAFSGWFVALLMTIHSFEFKK